MNILNRVKIKKIFLILVMEVLIFSDVFSATTINMRIQNPGVTDFSVSPIQNPPLGFVTLYVDIFRNNPATVLQLTVNNPADSYSYAFSPLPTVVCPMGTSNCSTSFPGSIINDGEVTITLRETPSAKIFRYEMLFNLASNYNSSTFVNTLLSNELWSLTVGAGLDIEAACPISIHWFAPGSVPATGILVAGAASPPAPSGTLPADISVPGDPYWAASCRNIRPGIDLVMVLDKSGSMGWSAGSARPRIEVLRDAVEDFVETWKEIRQTEADFVPPMNNTDKIGIVFFDQDAPATWAGLPATLNDFSANNCAIATDNSADCGGGATEPDPVDAVLPGGSTSIGDGLLLADSVLGSPSSTGERKVILLMSDGMQNTSEIVSIDGTSGRVYTHPSNDASNPGGSRDLDNQDSYQIYSVTIGPSVVVSPAINQAVATATGGFYINAEEQPEQLRSFFLQLLQNFLRFSTIETVKLASTSVIMKKPYVTDIPVTGTTTSLFVNVLANLDGWLRLTLTPPNGGQPIVKEGSGALRVSINVNQNPHFGVGPVWAGNWKLRVDLVDPSGDIKEVPIDVVVLENDMGIKSKMEVSSNNYIAGEDIKLRVDINELGDAVTGLKSQGDSKVLARLLKPGESIGDLLSRSSAPSNNPVQGDSVSAAEAKLLNAMQEGDFLSVKSGVIELFDNGLAANGDEKSGDGVYSAIYSTEIPGHYNFLFAVEGNAPKTGRFSRQQLKTVYMRASPDVNNTEVNVSTGVNTATVVFTPKTKYGSLLGPGWGNYFWVKTSDGTPIKAKDNLDGTYTAMLSYAGNVPVIQLHFVDALVVISDDVTYDKLPVALNTETVFIPDASRHDSDPDSGGACGCFELLCFAKKIFN